MSLVICTFAFLFCADFVGFPEDVRGCLGPERVGKVESIDIIHQADHAKWQMLFRLLYMPYL
jgi:hypothetical protein